VSPTSLASQFEWLWTWSGKCLGYRNQDDLYSYKGRHIGHFAEGDEIYGHDGSYLGEVRTTGRLITNLCKYKWRRRAFSPLVGRGFEQKTDMIGKNIPEGFTDFPTLA
jgi:4-fold beta flower protein